ncbi:MULTISPECIES: hypothetical protein [Olivibacter]|uniref:Uncharacterized protein n=1 Tax=Olivibacter jilunii TaxID=985016 RepID=A0ABW6AWK4_9SPHI
MKTLPNEPAYPIETIHEEFLGMSKREYFASMALQGLVSNDSCKADIVISKEMADTYAQDAVTLADALIKALNK